MFVCVCVFTQLCFQPSSPLRFSCDAMNQLLVVIDFSLQLHLHTQQVLVGVHQALHFGPHLLQLLLQVKDQLVEGGQVLAVLHFGAFQGLLQVMVL